MLFLSFSVLGIDTVAVYRLDAGRKPSLHSMHLLGFQKAGRSGILLSGLLSVHPPGSRLAGLSGRETGSDTYLYFRYE
jgi:hypothetical protein